MISRIFWSVGENRVRTGWRLLIQLVLFVAVLLGENIFVLSFGTGWVSILLANLLYLAGGLGLAWLMARFVDRRPCGDFGFHLDRSWWLDLGFGLGLGAFLMTGMLLTMRAAGWLTMTKTSTTSLELPFSAAFLLKVVSFTVVAINEEWTFRGYQLKNLAEGFANRATSWRRALVLAFLASSALFGLVHAANPDSTFLSTLNVAVLGLALGLPYLLTGELGASIGFHLTWNLFLGVVYGFAVGGNLPVTHLFSIQQSGPALWTGGAFGPEGGLLLIVWLLVGSGLTIAWAKGLRKRLSLHAPLTVYAPRGRQLPSTGE